LFHPDVPWAFIDEVWRVMTDCPQHSFQVLTKRPKRMANYLSGRGMWANIWLGATVENNKTLWRIDALKKCPPMIRFLSFEPLLEPLQELSIPDLYGVGWAIIGCESGPKRRRLSHSPMRREEALRRLTGKCMAADVPVYIKQLEIGGKVSRDPSEWPEDLRIREWPKGE